MVAMLWSQLLQELLAHCKATLVLIFAAAGFESLPESIRARLILLLLFFHWWSASPAAIPTVFPLRQ